MSRRGVRHGRPSCPGSMGFLLLPAVASGTAPPAVTLTGVPNDCYQFNIQITTGGALGAAIFQWSSNGGVTFTTNVTTAATVALGTTGVTANFPNSTYTNNNVYIASMVPIG